MTDTNKSKGAKAFIVGTIVLAALFALFTLGAGPTSEDIEASIVPTDKIVSIISSDLMNVPKGFTEDDEVADFSDYSEKVEAELAKIDTHMAELEATNGVTSERVADEYELLKASKDKYFKELREFAASSDAMKAIDDCDNEYLSLRSLVNLDATTTAKSLKVVNTCTEYLEGVSSANENISNMIAAYRAKNTANSTFYNSGYTDAAITASNKAEEAFGEDYAGSLNKLTEEIAFREFSTAATELANVLNNEL